jgi:hypothetical protein
MAERGALTERGREMRRVLAAQRRSGLSLVEFARRRGLRANTLSWWRHRLRDSDDDGEPANAERFIEITPDLGVRDVQAAGFEIVLGDGKVVRVPERFGEESLRRLLAALRC